MSERYVLAYDLGTSGVKAALVTMQGEVVHTATAGYPLYTPQVNWAEQDPDLYWQGVCTATRQVIAKAELDPSLISGLALGTMWKGIVPLNKDGKVLHNSIIWLDARAEDQARRLNEHFGRELFVSSDYWPKLMWLRENRPEVLEEATVILETNAYMKWKATGTMTVDISNSFLRSFDPELDAFYRDYLEFIDVPREKIPPFVKAEELVGHITEEAAAEMGLAAGIPVFGGCNYIQAISVGSGCSDVGGVHIYFGSSGWVGYSLPHQVGDFYLSPFDYDRDLSICGMQAIGLSMNWVAYRLFAPEYAEKGDDVFRYIDSLVEEIPAGSCGALATPWFYGERAPLLGDDARGNFLNLGPQHDRRHMARAIMEGVCYQLKMISRRQQSLKGAELPEAITVVGGGSCSGVWMQMLANVLNRTIRVPYSPRHTGAVGVAYTALIGLGVCEDYTDAARKIRYEHVYQPQADAVAVYEKGYAVFEQLYTVLKPMFSAMNK